MMGKISREAACIAAANLVQAVMAARSAKSPPSNPAASAEALYRRFFAMVRNMEE